MTTIFVNALFLFMTLASVTAISGMTKIYDEYAGKRHETLINEDGDVCLVPPRAIDEDDCETKHSKVGMLDPSDIENLTVYNDWRNETMTLNGETIPVAKGHITWPLPLGRKTKFSVLPSLFPREEIDKVLGVLRRYKNFDGDIDSVDRMPTHEIFVHNGALLLFLFFFFSAFPNCQVMEFVLVYSFISFFTFFLRSPLPSNETRPPRYIILTCLRVCHTDDL